jgi:hypothetical protein
MLTSWSLAGIRSLHDEPVGPGLWKAILSKREVERLRAILLDPARSRNHGTNARSYLLSGFLFCGAPDCDKKLVARPRGDKARCYVCVSGPDFEGCGKIRRLSDPVEELVVGQVLAALDNDAFRKAITPKPRDDSDVLDTISELERRLLTLGDDHDAGLIDRTEWMHRRTKVTERLAELRSQICTETDATGAVTALGDLYANGWDALPFDRKRAVLAAVVGRIIILPARRGLNRFDPDKIQIGWRA